MREEKRFNNKNNTNNNKQPRKNMEATHKNPAAVALGTVGGRAKSERKTAAVRINAAAGGRATRAWWQSPAGLARRAAMRKP